MVLCAGAMKTEQHPFFKKVSSEQLQGLLTKSQIRSFPDEAIIFEEGSEADTLFLVLSGRVSFRKRLPSDHLLTVSLSEAGDHFGEIGLLTGGTRSLLAQAHGQTELLAIPRRAILSYLKDMPGPVESLLASVIRHLHETTRHYVEDMVHQEKMAIVGNMMNSIIHDFNNPFCLISMSAQLLRQRHPDEQTVRLCQNIEGQVNRMIEMASDLTDFARGKYHLNLMAVDLRAIMEEFRSLNFPFFDNENIEITIDIPGVRILAERSKLMRVLQNLVGNAIDAIGEKPGGRVTITAQPEAGGKMLVLKIADNGQGIPEPIRARFFEPFVTHGKSGGTGLGTAIAKSIVEAHGGEIRFETAANEGTIFYISLPLAES